MVRDVLQRGQEVLHDELLVQPAAHEGQEVQRVDLYAQVMQCRNVSQCDVMGSAGTRRKMRTEQDRTGQC